MQGYFTQSGYYGLVEGRYRLFASETDYFEYVSESGGGDRISGEN